MMRRAALLLAFLTFLHAAACREAAAANLTEAARMFFEYPSFARGDRDGVVKFALAASREFQGTPLAELAVRVAMSYEPSSLSSINIGETEARRMLDGEQELSPEHRDILRRFVARNLSAAGRRREAMELHRRRGMAMSWLLAGPFQGRRHASFDSRELPVAGLLDARDVVAEPPDPARFREWRRNPPWRPLPENRSFPFIRPWQWARRDADGSMLMFTTLKMEQADNLAAFHVFSDVSWRLYVDGAVVAEINRNGREVPLEHVVPFSLDAGTHKVILQLFPPRLGVDAKNMRMFLRLESGANFSWDRAAASPDMAGRGNARREAKPLRFLAELDEAKGRDPVLMVAYALACMDQGMLNEAAWWAETAARNDPVNTNLKLVAGALTAADPLLPPKRGRDLAAAWHRSALAGKADLVPSLIFMAGIAAEAGREAEAFDYLERARAANPSSLDVMLARGEWANRFASSAVAREIWDECGRIFPNSPIAQLAIASLHQDGFLDMDRRLAACRAALAAGPYNPDASLNLAEALADSGNGQEAGYILRDAMELFAGDMAVLNRIADIYARMSLFKEAVAVLEAAARLAPDHPELWRRLGDLHMEAGNADAAEKCWRASLAASPGQFQLVEMMNRIDGKSDRLYDDGDYDAIAMTAAANLEKYSGDVVRLLDRSVIIVAEDGSCRRLTHEIDLARTRVGGESLATIPERGELLTARIVFPNGNTLEPEPYPGQGGLRLPAVIPGAARELITLETIPVGPNGVAAMAPWFFQDPSGRTPFLLSEYLVRVPRDFPLSQVLNDLGDDVDFEVTRDDDADVYRWTASVGLPSREPDAVHVFERVPSVQIGIKTSWDDVAFRELRALDGRLVPSMRMRTLLTALMQSSPEERPDPERAARAIYRYVCDNIDPTPAADVASHILVDRMGDRVVLLLALLRAAGLDACPAGARPSEEFLYPPMWELPSRDVFTVPLVRLSLPGGQVRWLDVRFDSLPFGKIADDLSGAAVFSSTSEGPLFDVLPRLPADESSVQREKMLRLPAADGDELVAICRNLRRGVAGLRRGQALADADTIGRKRIILSSLFDIFPDAVLNGFEAVRPESDDASSRVRYEVVSKFPVERRPDGSRAVSLCLAPPQVISTETRNLTRRRTVCHIKTMHVAEDRNVFVLPEGAFFIRLPEPVHIPSRFGMYQLRVNRRGADTVEVARSYTIRPQRIPPWEWDDFLAFLEQVDAAERQWLEYGFR